jgi:hypothetical protein
VPPKPTPHRNTKIAEGDPGGSGGLQATESRPATNGALAPESLKCQAPGPPIPDTTDENARGTPALKARLLQIRLLPPKPKRPPRDHRLVPPKPKTSTETRLDSCHQSPNVHRATIDSCHQSPNVHRVTIYSWAQTPTLPPKHQNRRRRSRWKRWPLGHRIPVRHKWGFSPGISEMPRHRAHRFRTQQIKMQEEHQP